MSAQKFGPERAHPIAVVRSALPAFAARHRIEQEARMTSKVEVLAELRTMLADVFAAKASGEAYGRLARAHGYVDGYMRALLELNVVTKAELLDVVNAERERSSGPAMRATAEMTPASTLVLASEIAR